MYFKFVKGFIIAIFIIVVASIGYRAYLISRIKRTGPLYEITIPGNKTQETNFFTKQYVERDECISFKDELGRSHRVCGMYNITEY